MEYPAIGRRWRRLIGRVWRGSRGLVAQSGRRCSVGLLLAGRGDDLRLRDVAAGVLADYVGPAACNEPEGAAGIIRALVGAAGNRPLFWDVPNENEPAQALAKALGFTPARLLTRMRLGPKTGQGGPCAQFAIANPAVG